MKKRRQKKVKNRPNASPARVGEALSTNVDPEGSMTATITTPEVQRLGNTQVCPACGTEVHQGAYCCPRCRNYFCFRCRARLVGSIPQFQCENIECDFHGKLVCGCCDPEIRKKEPPVVYVVHEGGWWPYAMLASIGLLAYASYHFPFWIAVAFSVIAFAGVSIIMRRLGVNVFGKDDEIVEPRETVFHMCIRCLKPVKDLR